MCAIHVQAVNEDTNQTLVHTQSMPFYPYAHLRVYFNQHRAHSRTCFPINAHRDVRASMNASLVSACFSLNQHARRCEQCVRTRCEVSHIAGSTNTCTVLPTDQCVSVENGAAVAVRVADRCGLVCCVGKCGTEERQGGRAAARPDAGVANIGQHLRIPCNKDTCAENTHKETLYLYFNPSTWCTARATD